MPTQFREIDLLTLEEDSLWEMIEKMTVPGWSAQTMFKSIRKRMADHVVSACLLLLYDDDKPVAWNFHLQYRHASRSVASELWAFTDPNLRKKGYQKILMPESRQRFGRGCNFQNWYESQKKAFRYYTNS